MEYNSTITEQIEEASLHWNGTLSHLMKIKNELIKKRGKRIIYSRVSKCKQKSCWHRIFGLVDKDSPIQSARTWIREAFHGTK